MAARRIVARMPDKAHPPAPGPIVQPNLAAIESAVRDVTFPISKRDLLDQIGEGETVVIGGRNVDLRTLVRDLPDDFFESEDEFRSELEEQLGERGDGAEAITLPAPPSGFPEEMPLDAPGASDQPAIPPDNA
jgi:hypothetical protein